MISDGLRNDIYATLGNHRVNVEIMFPVRADEGEIVTIRIRPWKNGERSGYMILAGGSTVDEALLWATRALLNDRWIPLNWQQRSRKIGIVPLVSELPAKREAPALLQTVSRALFDVDGATDTPPAVNVPLNGSGDDPEPPVRIPRSRKGD